MTPRLETDLCDSEAARLLPWFVTGRLTAEESARVESHVAGCPACRADLAAQRELRSLMQADDRIEYAPQPSLQKLMSRIDELEREIAEPAPPVEPAVAVAGGRVLFRAGMPRWLAAAVVVQAVGLGLLGSLLWQQAPGRDDPAQYTTLGSPDTAVGSAARLRVVFAPETTAASLARLLGTLQAEIVAGPSEAGAYTIALRPTPGAATPVAASLARLRADPHVLFAEPVAGTPALPQ